jgi:hypothetical protein
MQLILGNVYWGWRVFPLHNQSLTQTLIDYRFLVTIILDSDPWTLIIILWLNPHPFLFPTTIPLRRHGKLVVNLTLHPRLDGDSTGSTLSGRTKLCLFDYLFICFGLINFSSYFHCFSIFIYSSCISTSGMCWCTRAFWFHEFTQF